MQITHSLLTIVRFDSEDEISTYESINPCQCPIARVILPLTKPGQAYEAYETLATPEHVQAAKIAALEFNYRARILYLRSNAQKQLKKKTASFLPLDYLEQVAMHERKRAFAKFV
jgi:hypothetical protein